MSALPLHYAREFEESEEPGVPAAWWDTFEDPPGMRAEVIQGELILSPSPSRAHQRAVKKLVTLLDAAVPSEWEALSDLEWRLDEHQYVVRSPRPDVLVVPKADTGPIKHPPLLVVEVVSRSDLKRLVGKPFSRLDGKMRDYAASGLRFYLEVTLEGTEGPGAWLSELQRDETNALLAQARGTERLNVEHPFPFSFCPSDLLD